MEDLCVDLEPNPSTACDAVGGDYSEQPINTSRIARKQDHLLPVLTEITGNSELHKAQKLRIDESTCKTPPGNAFLWIVATGGE
jgi:hypothetical protein